MLCQFTFENFKSYHGETTLDFQAADLPEFADTVITEENAVGLLPLCVVYGPNGGGKSSLLQALSCVISTVAAPVYLFHKNQRGPVFQQDVPAVPFLPDHSSAGEPSKFRLFFRVGQSEYRYLLALREGELVSESLYRKAVTAKKSTMIFERGSGHTVLGRSVSRKDMNANQSANFKMPYLSFLAIHYDIPVIREAMGWFEGCLSGNCVQLRPERGLMPDDGPCKRQILHALQDADTGIADYRFDGEGQLFLRRKLGAQEYELPCPAESEGVRKFLAVFPVLLLALREGRLVILDDLDANLHPKVLRYMISLFQDKRINRHGAQLLFTTHDTSILRGTVFRRDEIWFAGKNERNECELCALYEFRDEDNERIKNTADYALQYLEGRYGAVPQLSRTLVGDFA